MRLLGYSTELVSEGNDRPYRDNYYLSNRLTIYWQKSNFRLRDKIRRVGMTFVTRRCGSVVCLGLDTADILYRGCPDIFGVVRVG